MTKTRIAFDLDGVIVDKPPLIPKPLLEWLFKGSFNRRLYYRFPKSKVEQFVRKVSHFYLLRPQIKKNVGFVSRLAKENNYELYIISSRYSFLEKETWNWLKQRKMDGIFKKVFLNLEDNQPHLFKEKILKKVKADIFVDDDAMLADYLAEKLKAIKIFCFNPRGGKCRNAISISSLERLLK